MIVAREQVHDCMHRVRFRYSMQRPVDEALLKLYSDTTRFDTQTYDARHILPRSKVTFQVFDRDGRYIVAGALGLDYVQVTYQKRDDLDRTIESQEAALASL